MDKFILMLSRYKIHVSSVLQNFQLHIVEYITKETKFNRKTENIKINNDDW